jgi:streptogramin lyase
MTGARHRSAVAAALLLGTVALPACSGAHAGQARGSTAAVSAGLKPVRIIPVPKDAVAAAGLQSDGTMWVLADAPGGAGRALYRVVPGSGQVQKTIRVSGTAAALAESAGMLVLGHAAGRTGVLTLMDSRSGTRVRTIRLASPPREITAAGPAFYVLTVGQSGAAVSIVNPRTGRGRSLPVPRDAVSAVPDGQGNLYVLGRDGRISEIAAADGRVEAVFPIGDPGISLAMSPDGATLYALKGTDSVANVAVVDVATESVHAALPAPAGCRQIIVSPDGRELYDVVGTPAYGNLQVFPVGQARSGQR